VPIHHLVDVAPGTDPIPEIGFDRQGVVVRARAALQPTTRRLGSLEGMDEVEPGAIYSGSRIRAAFGGLRVPWLVAPEFGLSSRHEGPPIEEHPYSPD
jgi:hypothetical protein